MTAEHIVELAADFTRTSPLNLISGEKALSPELAGLLMFEEPLVGFAEAGDEYFLSIANSSSARLPLKPPEFWIEGAETVVSFFLPITQEVKSSNRGEKCMPSAQWMHARIDGQDFIFALCRFIGEQLEKAGYRAVVPSLDSRFRSTWSANSQELGDSYTSNWSERHVAYACGLGTFGLSRGIITKKGMAGRIGSVVTNLHIPPTPREYDGLYDYCSMCGVCVKRCPVDAISIEKGKRHPPCSEFLTGMIQKYGGYYGCGKCQTAVPCESGIPLQNKTRIDKK